ncbi:hypothetical protein AB0B01_30510 [Streptomyces sp. NPDC044571]|uniref:hypothetical protein n=1 Tax=Streptomyces sp. NPDC044571 TaxID=3155371 RepID=UPI0033C40AAD
MSSEQPGHGWQTAPADQTAGVGGAPGSGAPIRGSSHRGAWIGAGATLAAAVISVLGAYLLASGHGGAKGAPAPPAGQASAPQVSAPTTLDSTPGSASPSGGQAIPSAAAPSQAPSPKAAGTVWWEGALVIAYAEDKDLDSTPPSRSEINQENDFTVFQLSGRMLRPEYGAKALVWENSGTVPSYSDCAGVTKTQATAKDIEMKTGMVVCGRTNQGRVVRLAVKQLAGQAFDVRGTFEVVVWDNT